MMVFVMTALAFAGCGGSKDSSDDLKKVQKAGKLIVGMTDYEPMNYYDTDGKTLIGFDTEYTKLVCEQLGVTPEFVEIDWDNKEIELNAGNVDCLWNGVTYNESRAKTMSFSAPYVNNDIVVVVRQADADKYNSLEGLATAKIVAEGGSSAEEDVLGEDALKDANFTPVDSLVSSLMEVTAGTADAAVVDSTMANALVGKEAYADLVIVPDVSFAPELLAIAFRKGSDLPAEVDKITEKLIEDGSLAALAVKYGINLKTN
jgi:polar amino acid transport system substrate-binding protein